MDAYRIRSTFLLGGSVPTRHRRTILVDGKPLSTPALLALDKISQPGGHGYGEYSRIARRTVQRLADLQLVTLGARHPLAGRTSIPWAEITEKGRQALAAWREKLAR